MSFDVSALDGQYVSIDSIVLRLTLKLYDATNATQTNELYAITDANRGWVESQATWNNRATGTSWAGSSGLGTAGTDYDSTLLASVTVAGTLNQGEGEIYDFTFAGTSAQLTSLIDAWMVDNVDNAQANPGLLLLDPDAPHASWNRIMWYNGEASTASYRPKLIVNYTAVPEPSTLLLAGLGLLGVLSRRRFRD